MGTIDGDNGRGRDKTGQGQATAPTIPPRELGERFLRVARWSEMPRGGHFAALEVPELLVEDLRAFFRPFRLG
jgi:pimeloyl-ACP methyl ester carboxylesterase